MSESADIDRSNHLVVWKPVRPDFAISNLSGPPRGHSTYRETKFEVISRISLGQKDFDAFADIGLFGTGQSVRVEAADQVVDTAMPVTIDQRTGETLPDVPVNALGQLVGALTFTYLRYVVRRICDSGD